MIIVNNKNWLGAYRCSFRELSLECFPPRTHMDRVDGCELINPQALRHKEESDFILANFSSKQWNEVGSDAIRIDCGGAISYLSDLGFLKYLPSFLNDLLSEDTQVVDKLWNRMLGYFEGEYEPCSELYLTWGQVLCCILAWTTPEDYPIDTSLKTTSSWREYYYNIINTHVANLYCKNQSRINRMNIVTNIEYLNSEMMRGGHSSY